MSIKVEQITKMYGNQTALDRISFEVKNPEVVGFLGPNGAGKSTLMKILTTYIKASEGTAIVNGYNVNDESKNVQKSVGYLPEHNPLYLDMYIKEYLNFNAQLNSINKQRIEDVIELTGLTPEVHKKIGELSKGYRQRVGLANAILHNPEVLILDEPTTGLDPNQLVDIRQLIKTLGKEKTIFLSTHIMQEVEAMCDRVIIINKGKIVANKNLKELQKGLDQIITVEFDYRVEEAFIKQIEHITDVRNLNGFVYELTFSTSEDMRSNIFDFAQENGLKILQLNTKNSNLESLFRELTNS